jgi:prepilin-type N-terminal cleavage/methylation domain-containing protein
MNSGITPPGEFMKSKLSSNSGFSLTELLCVMAIIGILAGLYLGVIGKAFVHVTKFLDHLSGH